MKNLLQITVFVLGLFMSVQAYAQFSEGNGSKENPYQISSVNDLSKLASDVNSGIAYADKYFDLTTDLDLSVWCETNKSTGGWITIGNDSKSFQGKFNGNGYAINNVTINRPGNYYQGLFGQISNATIENLRVENVNITGRDNVGAITGAISNSTINNCFTSGNLEGNDVTGGIAGYVKSSSVISNSYSNCNVTGKGNYASIGGIVGILESSSLNYCYATGNIISTGNNDSVGGLAGYVKSKSSVTNCLALNSSVSANSEANKLVGFNNINNGINTYSNNYGLSSMTVKIKNTVVSRNNNNTNGTNIPLTEAQNFSFYNTAANWNTNAWDISNGNTTVWNITNNQYPHLQWSTSGDEPGEEGTETNPFLITSVADLVKLGTDVNSGTVNGYAGKYFLLTTDLDLKEIKNWVTIGYGYPEIDKTFQGIFDGNGKTISNLTIDGSTYSYLDGFYHGGLFGRITNNAQLKNLKLTNVNIKYSSSGALVGMTNNASIIKCYSDGTISGSYSGGLIGEAYNTTISQCCSDVFVDGASQTGGLIGTINNCIVNDCYSTGKVKGSREVGGFGGNIYESTISNCYSSSYVISSDSYCGGFGGYINHSTLNFCLALNSTVEGRSNNTLRFAGYYGSNTNSNVYVLRDIYLRLSGKTQPVYDYYNGLFINEMATAISRSELTSLDFYSNKAKPWNIAATGTGNNSSIWGIDGSSYPYLKWLNLKDENNYTKFSNGSGAANDPYLINSIDDLIKLSGNVNNNIDSYANKHFFLTTDLNMSDCPIVLNPIGNKKHPFKGNFNGNGKTISNLNLYNTYTTADYTGLFGYILNASIEKLGLSGGDIRNIYAGSIVGEMESSSLNNCYSSVRMATIDAGAKVGGLVGNAKSSSIKNSYFKGDIIGTALEGSYTFVGGIAAEIENTTINYCYVAGSIRLGTVKYSSYYPYAAGIAPITGSTSSIENCLILDCKLSGYATLYERIGSESEFNYAVNSLLSEKGKGNETELSIAEAQQLAFYKDASKWKNGVTWNISGGKKSSAIWRIDDTTSYPYLQWQNTTGEEEPGTDPDPEIEDGSQAYPYLIKTTEDLVQLANDVNGGINYNGKHFRLAADIDINQWCMDNGSGWNPIGSESKPFEGHFDGNKHLIKGLFFNRPGAYCQGLFGYISNGAKIENLGVVFTFIGGRDNVGAIAGAANNATISNCYTSGGIKGSDVIGGIVGYAKSGTIISDCYSLCDVAAIGNYASIGGIVGILEKSTINNCYAAGTIYSKGNNDSPGGIAGYIKTGSTVNNCMALNPSIEGVANANKIIGYSNNNNGANIVKNNYALSSMELKVGNSIVTRGNDNTVNGTAKTLSELQNILFYTNAGNWNTAAWNISGNSGDNTVWCIQNGNSYPYLQWQNIPATYTPYYHMLRAYGIYEEAMEAMSISDVKDSNNNITLNKNIANPLETITLNANLPEEYLQGAMFYIVNIQGKTITRKNINSSSTTFITPETSGIYILKVIWKNGTKEMKVIIK